MPRTSPRRHRSTPIRSSPARSRRSSTAPTGPTSPASWRSCWASRVVFFFYPKKDDEQRLLAEYAEEDTAPASEPGAMSKQRGGPIEKGQSCKTAGEVAKLGREASRRRALLVAPPRAVGSPRDRLALEAGARQVLLSASAWAAGRSEASMPAYRYGIVRAPLFGTFASAIGPTGDWVPLVAVVLQGATLLAALSASGSSRRRWRIADDRRGISRESATVGMKVGDKNSPRSLVPLRTCSSRRCAHVSHPGSLARRRRSTSQIVLGAVCAYVLLGSCGSFAYAAIGTRSSRNAHLQQQAPRRSPTISTSRFVTRTIVGNG